MNIEHIGFNVADPVAAAEWYCKHLGMTIARQFGPPANGRFLADTRGKMMLEFYHNPKVAVPDYRNLHPISLHVALNVDDIDLANRNLRVRCGKGGKERVLPLMRGAMGAVKDYLALRRSLLRGPDCGALLLGSRGMSFSGNFSNDGKAVYQTGHGAARDMAGADCANPVGQLLAMAMMLQESFAWPQGAAAIREALASVLANGYRTADIAGPTSLSALSAG